MNPLPSSPDAERSILGAILLDNEVFYQTDDITPEDWSLDSHRRIFAAMAALAEDKKPIDMITLSEELHSRIQNRSNDLEAIGGVLYLVSLTEGLPRRENIEHYVKIVKDYSRKRKLIAILQAAHAEACAGESKTESIVAKVDRQILDLGGNKSSPKHISEILVEVDAGVEKLQSIDLEQESIGYRTGLKILDEVTTGYRKREYTIIAGWTADGKSTLLKQGLIAQAFDGIRSAVFSREISRQQLILDIKRYITHVTPEHARDPRFMTMLERAEFKKANEEMKNWPVWVDDSRKLHIDEVRRRARRLIREEDVQIIWLDYIGLFKGDGKTATEITDYISEGLWNLADEENIPVIALSQLSRDKEKKKRRPMLMDLKQSGRLEQDAHCVIFTFRPEGERGFTGNDEVIIAKQRHGKTAILEAEFDERELVFKPRTRKYD